MDLGIPVGKAPTVSLDVNINVPRDLLSANLLELSKRGESVAIHRSAEVSAEAHLDQVVVGPEAVLGPGVSLSRALVLPKTTLEVPITEPDDVAIYGRLYQPAPKVGS